MGSEMCIRDSMYTACGVSWIHEYWRIMNQIAASPGAYGTLSPPARSLGYCTFVFCPVEAEISLSPFLINADKIFPYEIHRRETRMQFTEKSIRDRDLIFWIAHIDVILNISKK